MNKIPVGQTIAKDYRFAFGDFGAVLGVVWLPVAIMAVSAYFLFRDVELPLRLLDADPHVTAQNVLQIIMLLSGPLRILELVLWVCMLVIGVGLTRTALGIGGRPHIFFTPCPPLLGPPRRRPGLLSLLVPVAPFFFPPAPPFLAAARRRPDLRRHLRHGRDCFPAAVLCPRGDRCRPAGPYRPGLGRHSPARVGRRRVGRLGVHLFALGFSDRAGGDRRGTHRHPPQLAPGERKRSSHSCHCPGDDAAGGDRPICRSGCRDFFHVPRPAVRRSDGCAILLRSLDCLRRDPGDPWRGHAVP